jgi:hypothetical protein
MDKGKENLNLKVNYVKPAIIDLGAVTIAFGGDTCEPGGTATLYCTGGSVASEVCDGNGLTAGNLCGAGNDPLIHG